MPESKLLRAKRELRRAIKAKDPKRIAIASAKVAATDPKIMERFARIMKAASAIVPLVERFGRDKAIRAIDGRAARKLLAAELKKRRKIRELNLSLADTRLLLNAATSALRKARNQRRK